MQTKYDFLCGSFEQEHHISSVRFFFFITYKTGLVKNPLIAFYSISDKAEALNAVVNGPITPQVPGSVLRLHPNVIIVADEDALSEME